MHLAQGCGSPMAAGLPDEEFLVMRLASQIPTPAVPAKCSASRSGASPCGSRLRLWRARLLHTDRLGLASAHGPND